ncbi:MAG: hypothetical protein WDM96_03990 [Lacunisphaera sp.]
MKRFLLSLFVLAALTTLAYADKAVIIHPGDTLYLRFDVKGTKIKLAHAGSEKDDGAQVIFSLTKEVKEYNRTLKVENKFTNDFVYKVEMRSLSLNHQMRGPSTPVVGGKVSFDNYPMGVEELALFDFKLEP